MHYIKLLHLNNLDGVATRRTPDGPRARLHNRDVLALCNVSLLFEQSERSFEGVLLVI